MRTCSGCHAAWYFGQTKPRRRFWKAHFIQGQRREDGGIRLGLFHKAQRNTMPMPSTKSSRLSRNGMEKNNEIGVAPRWPVYPWVFVPLEGEHSGCGWKRSLILTNQNNCTRRKEVDTKVERSHGRSWEGLDYESTTDKEQTGFVGRCSLNLAEEDVCRRLFHIRTMESLMAILYHHMGKISSLARACTMK